MPESVWRSMWTCALRQLPNSIRPRLTSKGGKGNWRDGCGAFGTAEAVRDCAERQIVGQIVGEECRRARPETPGS